MIEQWIKWEPPIQGLAKCYDIYTIFDTFEEFSVLLSETYNEQKKVRVTFVAPVRAYRSTYETFRLKTVDKLYEQTPGCTFFKVENSAYLKWLSEQSDAIPEGLNLIHLSIVADNCVLDVITSQEPKVEFCVLTVDLSLCN